LTLPLSNTAAEGLASRPSPLPITHDEVVVDDLEQAFPTNAQEPTVRRLRFFDAAILIFSPPAGLRPSRCGVALTLNSPNRLRHLCAAHRGVDNILQEVVDDRLGLGFACAMRLRELCDEFG
jgi:hypothetical protein